MASLKSMMPSRCSVFRDGAEIKVDAVDLVPGDLVSQHGDDAHTSTGSASPRHGHWGSCGLDTQHGGDQGGSNVHFLHDPVQGDVSVDVLRPGWSGCSRDVRRPLGEGSVCRCHGGSGESAEGRALSRCSLQRGFTGAVGRVITSTRGGLRGCCRSCHAHFEEDYWSHTSEIRNARCSARDMPQPHGTPVIPPRSAAVADRSLNDLTSCSLGKGGDLAGCMPAGKSRCRDSAQRQGQCQPMLHAWSDPG